MKIPSDIKYIRKVSSKVIDELGSHKVDESSLYDIKLCIEEAVINAIVHGNKRDKRKTVKIAYWIKDDHLNIEVEDEGNGFDYRHLSDPTAGENIIKGSGRGVYLIKNLMDKMEFNDAGNKLKMTKYLEAKK